MSGNTIYSTAGTLALAGMAVTATSFAGNNAYVSGGIVASNYTVPTNTALLGLDMSRAMGEYTAGAAISLTAPINVPTTNYAEYVLFVTNATSPTPIIVTVPATWKTNAASPFNVTNESEFILTILPNKWTNCIWKPLW